MAKTVSETDAFLKTKTGGRRDRDGYLAALAEWERLKAFIDGLGPSPYTPTGALSPEEIRILSEPATDRTKLYIMLGLNLG